MDEGFLFGLLGPNHAGKTTAVKVLSTVIAAPPGSARLFGHDVVLMDMKRATRIGPARSSAGGGHEGPTWKPGPCGTGLKEEHAWVRTSNRQPLSSRG